MANVSIPSENRRLTDVKEISQFLAPYGIFYERWKGDRGVSADATSEEILKAYEPEINKLKARGGYVTADVINVKPDTPNLDAMIQKFNKEHTHDEDEIRYIVKGRGIFHIHPKTGPVFAIQTEEGDLINVPAGTQHWFDFCAERTIRAIRLFKDPAGWAPRYIETGVHGDYTPVCFGPTYVDGDAPKFQPVVKI